MGRCERLLIAVALAGCGWADRPVDDRATPTTTPIAAPITAPISVATSAASPVLAPSQLTGSTVPRPPTPGPCPVDGLVMWTAAIEPGRAALHLRNDGDVWCEIDLTGTDRLDPLAEPTVWLEPGDAATLVAADTSADCPSPSVERSVEFVVGGTPVSVPSALAACEPRLTALYPVDAAAEPCAASQLTTSWIETDDVLVIGLADGAACRLVIEGEDPSAAVVDLLEPGDVVAWPAETAENGADDGCDDDGLPPFDEPAVVAPDLPGCLRWGTPGPIATVAPELALAVARGAADALPPAP